MKVCQLIHKWNRWHWSSLLPEATITQTSFIFLWVKFPAPCNLKQLPSWLYLFTFTWTPLQQILSCWPACTGMNRFSLDLWASGDNWKSKGTDFFSSRFNSWSDARVSRPTKVLEVQEKKHFILSSSQHCWLSDWREINDFPNTVLRQTERPENDLFKLN